MSDAILWAGALVAALAGLWATIRKSASAIRRRVAPLARDWRTAMIVLDGRPAVTLPETGEELSPAIPGVLDRMAELEQGQGAQVMHLGKLARDVEVISGEVHHVRNEVTHNHGSSLKDAVRRIEQQLKQIDDRLQDGDSRFEQIENALETQAEANRAMWPAIEAVAKATPPPEEEQ